MMIVLPGSPSPYVYVCLAGWTGRYFELQPLQVVYITGRFNGVLLLGVFYLGQEEGLRHASQNIVRSTWWSRLIRWDKHACSMHQSADRA